ncbi:hypothetical protein H5410_040636 [Solanum commersonii]|uniref:Uncharacterized protein n=1 Tax=Solanum commersonii TaxID=4109 RepID=A0A9J5XQP9_SOLCO|nr:hypothetical protein H5410_040636 [Solanum commersonii]
MVCLLKVTVLKALGGVNKEYFRRTAEWFGRLDPAPQMTQHAHFQLTFSNSTPQSPKTRLKHALMEFKQDPFYLSPQNTKTSPAPEFAEFGHLTIVALKSCVTRSIIAQMFDI